MLVGVGLLDPNGGSEMNDLSARRSQRRLSSSDTSAPPGAEELLAAPLPLSKGRGGRGRGVGSSSGGAGGHAGRLGASGRRIRDLDPAVGVPAAGLANRHAAFVESRQRGQNHSPQPCVVAERRDALGEDKGLDDEGLTSNPLHQNLQRLPGQVSPWPALHPADVI
jgi:hypothetical protein